MIVINLTAILLAAVVQMILGALWYGPLFGRIWMRLSGFTQDMKDAAKKKGMAKTYAAGFVAAFVMSYVLANFVIAIGPLGVIGAMQLGFWLWLGFIATVVLLQVLWLNKPVKLYAIDATYYLVVLMVNTTILTLWQ